jgi:hypothetical protein
MPQSCGISFKCNANTGKCEEVIPTCDDKDVCTLDTFIRGVGCTFQPKCVSSDPCTIATCSNGNCAYTPKNCDDGKACTTDFCDSSTGKCQNVAKKCFCPAGNVASCNTTTGQCQYRPQCSKDSDCGQGGSCDLSLGCINKTPTVA